MSEFVSFGCTLTSFESLGGVVSSSVSRGGGNLKRN